MRHFIFISATMLALGACGGSSNAKIDKEYVEICSSQNSGKASQCECFAKVYRTETSKDVYDFHMLALRSDTDGIGQFMADIGPEKAVEFSTRMSKELLAAQEKSAKTCK